MPQAAYDFTVIGSGAWGTALALVLSRNGHRVGLWSREADHCANMAADRENQRYLPGAKFPETLHITPDLINSIQNSDHVLIAVPSHAFEKVIQQVHQYWPQEKTGLIWATKGLDRETGRFLSELATDVLGSDIPQAILTGPSFAKEVGQQLPTAVIIASDTPAFAQQMRDYFNADYFRVYTAEDLIGAQLGGAIKNVIAIAVGIADGLGYGMNAKAGLITRGLAEMTRLALTLGAEAETLAGLSGLGDLILTCSDNQSRNRRFGLAIGQGLSVTEACASIDQVIEGIEASQTLMKLCEKQGTEMPIATQVYRIIHQHQPAKQAVDALLGRPQGCE